MGRPPIGTGTTPAQLTAQRRARYWRRKTLAAARFQAQDLELATQTLEGIVEARSLWEARRMAMAALNILTTTGLTPPSTVPAARAPTPSHLPLSVPRPQKGP